MQRLPTWHNPAAQRAACRLAGVRMQTLQRSGVGAPKHVGALPQSNGFAASGSRALSSGCALIFVTRKPKRPFQRFQCLTQGMNRTTT